jgi:hypothetical protein
MNSSDNVPDAEPAPWKHPTASLALRVLNSAKSSPAFHVLLCVPATGGRLALVLFMMALALSSAHAQPEIKFQPQEKFLLVGENAVLFDPARTENYRYNKITNAFMFTCWDPAEPQAGAMPDAAWDKKLAQDWSNQFATATGNANWRSIIPQLKGHAILQVPDRSWNQPVSGDSFLSWLYELAERQSLGQLRPHGGRAVCLMPAWFPFSINT